MASSYNHRKLSADSSTENLVQICKFYCDPKNSFKGICPSECISFCTTCNTIPSQSAPPHDDFPKKSHKLPLAFKVSLAILVIAFFLFCCYTIYKFYTVFCNRSRNRSRTRARNRAEETHEEFVDEDYGPVLDHPIWYIRTVGLQPSVISAITICKYKKSEGLVEGTDCSVCLSEFQEDETLRLLPKCNHAFHIPCIDTWLRSHTNCPLCRAGIVRPSVAGSPLPELINPNLAPAEETQLGVLDENQELNSGREMENQEMIIRDEEGGEFDEIPKTEVGDVNCNINLNEIQPMRRSVSFDSSAAVISSEENLNTQLAKVTKSNRVSGSKRNEFDFNQSLLRLVGSSSIGRSLQKSPVSMKRSSSCGGKVVLSRQGRTRDSALP